MKFFKLSILSVAVILSIMLSITSCTGNKSHTDTDNESSDMQSVNDTVIDTKAYSGITTLPSSEVEEFASTVKKAYLDEDWETISSLIDYPITLYPDVKVNNAEEFLLSAKATAPLWKMKPVSIWEKMAKGYSSAAEKSGSGTLIITE